MNAWSSAWRGVARHPVLAFMLISLGVGFVTAAIPPLVDSEILPFGLPLHGVVLSLGAGLAAIELPDLSIDDLAPGFLARLDDLGDDIAGLTGRLGLPGSKPTITALFWICSSFSTMLVIPVGA